MLSPLAAGQRSSARSSLPGPTPRTRVTMRAVFPSPAALAHVVVTRRVVRAPRDLVYRVWTELAHLQQWFGPKGCTLTDCTLDLRPGGVFHYCMRFGAHGEMWGKWVFREVSRGRLVFVSSFSDPQGNVVRAPFSADWPLETLSTVTFDEHAGIGKGTVVTVTATPIAATPTEQAKFDGFHDSMRQGWGGTFDQLEAHLARAGG